MKYGVYKWRADGQYFTAQPVRKYKLQSAAQKFCDRDYADGNHGNYVVRELPQKAE